MIGFDTEAGIVKHYRVDKMTDIAVTEEKRDGADHFQHLDIAVYSKKLFSMFSGEEETVRIRFTNRLVGVVIDRFGRDIAVTAAGDQHFIINVKRRRQPTVPRLDRKLRERGENPLS